MSDLVLLGFELAMVGMGFVFFFLMLLVVLTWSMSRIILHFDNVDDDMGDRSDVRPGATRGSPSSSMTGKRPDSRMLAVISAAIMQHRTRSDESEN